MAAQALQGLIRALKWVAAAFAAAAALFLLSAWIGSSVPRNAGWEEAGNGIEIMVESNGVHTALILPLVNGIKDWRGDFPAEDIAAPSGAYTHVSISWGEKEVFLNTPTWSDLSPVTAARIVGIGGEGLLHVAHYIRPAPASDLRPLTITPDEYRKLVAQIGQAVVAPAARQKYPGYYAQDVFYDAPGHYTATNTCNQWTSDTLAAAGIKTGWWTPLAGGVMKWVPKAVQTTATLDKAAS
ncbi:TIGR02117 family protein [Altererythrobacter aquiaggeris]|uniref:TIGR02117 family protein n=1 Tax=Aestuarierythrobacter aquiaggeris TaxID=1898396 RepID=UPI00301B5168